MELQVGVKAILKNPEGRFLLLKANPDKYPTKAPAPWDIPGGRIELTTKLADNLAREIREETNLTLTTKPLLLTAQDIIREDKHVVRLTFTAECNEEIKLDLTEHTDYKWLFMEEIAKLEGLDPFAQEAFQAFTNAFFPKLIRDKIPEHFKKKYGVETESDILSSDQDFFHALLKKLVEESSEVQKSKDMEMVKNELADVLEVIDTILKLQNWTWDEIRSLQNLKKEARGGFERRLHLKIPYKKDSA